MSKVQDDVVKITIIVEDGSVRSTSVFNKVLDTMIEHALDQEFMDAGTKFRLSFKAFQDDAGIVETTTKTETRIKIKHPVTTVAEVVAKLQTFPQDAEVVVYDDAETKAIDDIVFDDEEPEKVLIW